jgi:hypothetical protein
MFGGPGTLWGSETPGAEGILESKDLWEQEGTKNNKGPGTFEGPENPWRPDKPIFLYFFKYNCQPIASLALLHFPGFFFESPWDPLGQSYNCDMGWSRPLTGQSYNRDTAGSRPYSTFLSPSGRAHDLAFTGPHLMRVIWSSGPP